MTIENLIIIVKSVFRTVRKLLLHTVYEELPSYLEIERVVTDQHLREEVDIDPVCYSSLPHRTAEINQEIFIEIFAILAQNVSILKPSSKSSSLQINDSTMIPLNKMWFPWVKFRKT